MNFESIVEHYSRAEVSEEIAKFSRKKWIGLHCEKVDKKGRNYLIRYSKEKIPLKIRTSSDVTKLLNDFKELKPRTFYATINAYRKIESTEDVQDPLNIESSTPTFDIDNSIEEWRATIAVAESIIEFLEKNGVEKSIILKWSGNGMHIHLNPYSISPDLLKKLNVNPIDIAFSIVEYVNGKLNEEFIKIKESFHCERLKVENEIDQQRLFTCILSLHRNLNSVCICISRDDLKDFDPSWISVEGYRHYKAWDNYEFGEADELAEKSYLEIGGFPYSFKTGLRKKRKSIGEEIIEWIRMKE
ncbi:MAG: hypothetical protein QXG01_06760 [Candidatus Bathyarchaeia archaeon]